MVQAAVGDGREDLGDPEAAGVGGQGEQADQEGDITELGDEEGLQGGGTGLGRLPVVPDQEVRADAHDLPADQEHHQVAGVDDEQHRGGEEGDQGRVGGVAGVVAEVGRGVELYAGGDEPDEDGDQDREAVQVQGQVDGDRPGGVSWVAASMARPPPWRTATTTARTVAVSVGRIARGGRSRGGAAEREPGDGTEEGQERDEGGEGRRGHAVASAFLVCPAVVSPAVPFPAVAGWPSVSASAVPVSVSAVSRSRSMSEEPRLR